MIVVCEGVVVMIVVCGEGSSGDDCCVWRGE